MAIVFFTEPVSLPILIRCFDQAVAYCTQNDSSGPTIHSHGFYCDGFKLICSCKIIVFTALTLLGALYNCTSFHRPPIQMYPGENINTREIHRQTSLSNPRCSRTDSRPDFCSALLITSFIAECLEKQPALYLQDKQCKPYHPSVRRSNKNGERKPLRPL